MAQADPPSSPTAALDASALIALLHDEPGSETVVGAIDAGAAISSFNLAEVLSKVAGDGDDPRAVAELLFGTDSDPGPIRAEAPTIGTAC